MEKSHEKINERTLRMKKLLQARSAAPPKTEDPVSVNESQIPVTIKLMTDRILTDGSEFEIPGPPPGMCIDFDVMEEDESGEAGIVLIAPGEPPAVKEPEHEEMVVQGLLKQRDDCVLLTWKEYRGEGIIEAAISFDPAMPEVVTLCRATRSPMDLLLELIGADQRNEVCFVFEGGKRHISLYDSGDGVNELAVRTFRIKNSLLDRGAMMLDFAVEIHGMRAEKTKMLIKIRRDKT